MGKRRRGEEKTVELVWAPGRRDLGAHHRGVAGMCKVFSMIPACVPEARAGKGDAGHDGGGGDEELASGQTRLRHV